MHITKKIKTKTFRNPKDYCLLSKANTFNGLGQVGMHRKSCDRKITHPNIVLTLGGFTTNFPWDPS
jgi:hypothetical protein